MVFQKWGTLLGLKTPSDVQPASSHDDCKSAWESVLIEWHKEINDMKKIQNMIIIQFK